MRKTKIICTIGPACESEAVLEDLCKSGMNVARLNFSHGTHEYHLSLINKIKAVREKLEMPIAIMLDTKGPEYRIKTFENGKITLNDGDKFVFTTDDIIGNNERVSVNYKGMINDLSVGDKILVNNGLVIFEVKELTDTDAICTVISGGDISNSKSMSFPNKVLNQAYLSEQDKSDLLFGIENGVDFIACSFVSRKQDLVDVKSFIKANGGENIDIIAKIENRSGVDNIEEICQECDGIMVARGDLGVEIPFVEIPFEEVPSVQKYLINKFRMMGKRIITATEMLESMIHNPRPTRAEISDVANAVYDGTSAIMLSGETAMGKYPALTVQTMSKIAEKTESCIDYASNFSRSGFIIKNDVDAISHSTACMAIDVKSKAIVVSSISGITARMVSRFRAPIDIIGMTTSEKTWRKLALSWGVTPVMCERVNSTDVLFYMASKAAKSTFKLKKGDKIIVTGGVINGESGNTNIIKLETI